jgi:drug/metabolite transporter (DMT)-like permease
VAGAYIYLQPLFASLIAILFLRESLDWFKILAGLLIFTGVYLVGRKKAVQ